MQQSRMEALYMQLYDKYQKLKDQKESDLEKSSQEQELKFLDFVSVAENTLKCLQDENKKLTAQINYLTNLDSSAKDHCSELERILREETEKTRGLSGEGDLIPGLPVEGFECNGMNKTSLNDKSTSLSDGSNGKQKTGHSPHMRHRGVQTEEVNDTSCTSISNDHNVAKCCGRPSSTLGGSGDSVGQINCLFQNLIQCLVGMRFSVASEARDMSISVLHESSGYSFSLTLVNGPSEEESELLYRLSSLGTLERVATDWMREDIMFGSNMCPVFFDRLSRVIKLH